MTQLGERRYTAPLFDIYSLQKLNARTGYNLRYLGDVAEGRTPLTPRFRKAISAILQRPEAELFYPAGSSRHDGETGLHHRGGG